MANLNFDASTVAPATAPEPIPAGWYTGMMTASEMKPTSTGNGAYLETEYTIQAPAEYAGRKVFDRINLQNSNPVAVEIGYKTLSAICHAVGVIQVQDSAQLHNRPLQIKVSLRPAGKGGDGNFYEASNDVKGYKAVGDTAPAGGASPALPSIPPAASAPAAWTPPAAPAASQEPAPPAPAPAPATSTPQRPTDPTHIHAAGTPQEQWWINGAWAPAPVGAAPQPAPAPAPSAPAAGAVPPWQQGATATPAQTPAAAAPAAVPPWAQK